MCFTEVYGFYFLIMYYLLNYGLIKVPDHMVLNFFKSIFKNA